MATHAPRAIPQVMVSSTFTDLQDHRTALIGAIHGHKLHANVMENDSARLVDVIDSSLQMVRDSSAYIGVIGLKYGQTPECPKRNPGKLSITELEFDEAQRLGRPILLFVMGEDHPVKKADVERDPEKEKKLNAFLDRAKKGASGSSVNRVYAVFNSLEEFKDKLGASLADLSKHLESESDAEPEVGSVKRVFLSYRRDDTQFISSALYEKLEEPSAFGPNSVFMDVDSIPPGVDFREVIAESVGQCEFFLAIIGKNWVNIKTGEGRPRLMDPADFVRLEIEAALSRQIPITPVLVDGASMPRADDLPASLHPLVFKNASVIRHGKDFRLDIQRLVKGLQEASQWYSKRVLQPSQSGSGPHESGAVPTNPIPVAKSETAGQRVTRLQNEAASKHAGARAALILHDYERAATTLADFRPELLAFRDEALFQQATADRDRLRYLHKEIHDLLNADKFKDPRLPGLIAEFVALKANDPDMNELAAVYPASKIGQTITNALGMKFVWVPPGESWLGGGGGKQGERKFTLEAGFWTGVYPVMQAEWHTVVGGVNPSKFKGDRLPVESVSADLIDKTFLVELTKKCRGDGYTYRLPTADEWEYFARGGPIRQDQSGFDFYFAKSKTDLTPNPTCDLDSTMANFDGRKPDGKAAKGRYLEKTTEVGLYLPNPLGLYDLVGNVWEWTSTVAGSARVSRGGSWYNILASNCAAASRRIDSPNISDPNVGFRLLAVPS